MQALYSYRRYLADEHHHYYPEPDPELLRAAIQAQKAKRVARRVLIESGVAVQDLAEVADEIVNE